MRTILMLALFTGILGPAHALITGDKLPMISPSHENFQYVHACHAATQRLISGDGAGLHHHEGEDCRRITDPEPKRVRNKRGLWCQNYCVGAFPYIACKLENCSRSR